MDWKIDTDGIIVMYPLSGWETATLPKNCIAVAIEVVPNEDALQTGERLQSQVSMTVSQAREFAQALLKAADTQYIPRPQGHA